MACLEHLLLEISAEHISDACTLKPCDAIAEDVRKNQRFRTKHLRIAEQIKQSISQFETAANFYCLDHLLLEISAEHISDACTPSFVTLLQKMSGKTRGFGPNI